MTEPGNLTSAQQTELTSQAYRRADFLFVDFPSGRQAWTSLPRAITDGGVTYSPAVLRSHSGIRSNEDRAPTRIQIELPGTDTAIRSAIANDAYHLSRVVAHFGLFDENSNLIGGLIRQGEALLSSADFKVSEGSAIIELTCESPTALFLRDRRVIAQDADQRWRYAGDLFLNLRPHVQDAEAEWGGQKQGGNFAGVVPEADRNGEPLINNPRRQ